VSTSRHAHWLTLALIFQALSRWSVQAAPGTLLDAAPNLAAAELLPAASAVAPDGSVFVRGAFTGVDGFPRPGLVRLLEDGTVDPDFQPAVVDVTDTAPSLSPVTPPASTTLLPLSDGTLLSAGPQRLTALAPDGTRDERFDLLHQPGRPVQPLFEHAGRIYFLRATPEGGRLEAVHADTLTPVSLDAQDTWPAPFQQAAPAGGEKRWVLTGTTLTMTDPLRMLNSPRTLLRILPDGTIDPEFAPLALPGQLTHFLRPRSGGGFCLVSANLSGLLFWPAPSVFEHRIAWHSAEGAKERESTLWLPASNQFIFHAGADDSIIYASPTIPMNLAGLIPPDRLGPAGALFRIQPDGAADPSFVVALEALALAGLPDGGFLHSHHRRMRTDGTPDPGAHVPRFTTDPVCDLVGRLDDGHVVVRISGGAVSWQRPGMQPLILTPDLQVDATFQPPPGLPIISSIHLGADRNSVLLALKDPHIFPDATKTRLLRLFRDGSVDPASPRYIPTSNSGSIDPGGGIVYAPFDGPFSVHPLPDGGFLVQYLLPGMDVPSWEVRKIRPDGSADPAFLFASQHPSSPEVRVLSDGSLYRRGAFHHPDGTLRETVPDLLESFVAAEWPDGSLLMKTWLADHSGVGYTRWRPGAGRDPGFICPLRPDSNPRCFLPLPGGGLILAGVLHLPDGTHTLARLHPDGRHDPSFRAPAPARILPAAPELQFVVKGGELLPAFADHRTRVAEITSLLPISDNGALLVAGNFTHLGTSPRQGLALLSLREPADVREWMAATLGDGTLSPMGDEDRDGRHNLEEYATGTDPARADASPTVRVLPSHPPAFEIPLNPHARGVRMIPQLSTDLAEWVDAGEARLRTLLSPEMLRLESAENASALFLRLRFEPADEAP
jgi:hypothetical protein